MHLFYAPESRIRVCAQHNTQNTTELPLEHSPNSMLSAKLIFENLWLIANLQTANNQMNFFFLKLQISVTNYVMIRLNSNVFE